MNIRGSTANLFLGNATLIGIWFVTWLTLGDSFWLLAVINRVIPFLFIPSILLVMIAFVRRRPELIALSLVPILIFAYLYAPHFTPVRIELKSPITLRVMTFNVLFSNRNSTGVEDLLSDYQPDLVALQEVKPRMLKELTQSLRATYPYSFIAPENEYGTTAILSKFPFVSSNSIFLGVDRPASIVEIEVQGRPVQFISAHLIAYGLHNYSIWEMPYIIDLRTRQQNNQAEILLGSLDKSEDVIKILGCDCNTKETSGSYRILAREFLDSSREVGLWYNSPLFPGERRDMNLQHIDYVLFQGPIRPLTTRTIANTAGSDHRPLIAEFEFMTDD
jgi:endonuclease/exonuclease/phosphatase (EEP) superfamily protein YafD